MLAKVNLKSNQKVLIVGGITADGTGRMGKYLCENWREIYHVPDPNSPHHITVKDNEFAMAISVPLPDGKMYREKVFVDDSQTQEPIDR